MTSSSIDMICERGGGRVIQEDSKKKKNLAMGNGSDVLIQLSSGNEERPGQGTQDGSYMRLLKSRDNLSLSRSE